MSSSLPQAHTAKGAPRRRGGPTVGGEPTFSDCDVSPRTGSLRPWY